MKHNTLNISICIPAHNEGKNIGKILRALLAQETSCVKIESIIVVSSASTDETDFIVKGYASIYPHVFLLQQTERQGKAAAINAFLRIVKTEIVVIESADTIPAKDCIEKLCLPFLNDETIGMTGGAPHPVNNPDTFLGYIVHAWWWFHRNIPRFGEIIAYRNILHEVSPTTSVDEAYIQAKMTQMGYNVVHVDEAVVRNKGADNISDLIKQRRRVMNGHARLYKEEKIKINNMTKSSVKLLLFEYKFDNPKQLIWFMGGMGIEIYARILGWYDFSIKGKNPFVWEMAGSTKDLSSIHKGVAI